MFENRMSGVNNRPAGMLTQRDYAAMDTLFCWVVEAIVLLLAARMKGDGGSKKYVRVLFLEISDPNFDFGQLIRNKMARAYRKRFVLLAVCQRIFRVTLSTFG